MIKKTRRLKPGSSNSYSPIFCEQSHGTSQPLPFPLPTQQIDAATPVLNLLPDQQYFLDPCRTDS